MIGMAADRIYGALPGCDSLASRYDRALTGLGGPFDETSRTGFARAREGCVREASTMASASRATACRSAVQYFGRALERRQSLAAIPVTGTSGSIGGSAAGVTTGEDGSREESVARSLLAECRG